jgi:hypothetical protein
MKKHVYLFAVVIFVLYAFGAQEVVADQLPLGYFLQEAGNKCDVYFTLEGAYEGTTYSSMLLGQRVTSQGLPADVESLIFALTNSIPNLTVKADAANKLIYHIMDKRLLASKDYVMNEVLESVKFDGNAAGLVDRIKEKLPRLSNQSFGQAPVLVINNTTGIALDAKTVSVRDALSNGVNLVGYNRLVWTSFTSLETYQTMVHFLGQLPRSEH